MTPERWQQVKEIFHSALQHAPAEQSAFLSNACGEDGALRKEVESLIASHEKDGSFIDSPAYQAAANILTSYLDLKAGQTLGYYEIVSTLGRGGMGEVYLARDIRLGRRVALKFLPAVLTQNQERLHRFKQEARAASALNHPNILTIYEIGEVEGRNFIATEFIDGDTLRKQIVEDKFETIETLRIAEQIASALSEAHGAGIIHRDIKPENIMLRRDGILKVLDFGLAKLAQRQETGPEDETRARVQTTAGVLMGTIAYMSPEQARGLVADERTDIFSLGVVIYEMVAGQAPFGGASSSDLIVSLLEKEPAPLARFSHSVPERLEEIVTKTLAKDREERYQSVKDLLIDLRRLKQRLEVDAEIERTGLSQNRTAAERKDTTRSSTVQPTSSAAYSPREIKRRKSAAIAALVILLLALSALGYWYLHHRYSNGSKIESIAVMPFVNASPDPNNEYLSDGITESLINSLSQLPNLKMISSSSALRYKGKEVDPQTVGRALGVQALLMGRVVQRGDNLSISAELVDVQNNSHLWGEQYERKFSDLQAVQREITQEISNNLRLKLSGDDQNRMSKHSTESSAAYQVYLKGRFYQSKSNPDEYMKSRDYFEQALNLDPNFALGHAGLASFYSGAVARGISAPREAWPKCEAEALKALEIDNALAEAHDSLAATRLFYYWDWAAAEREIKTVIAINPNYTGSHALYADYLVSRRRFDEAIEQRKRVLELDPISLLANHDLARTYFFGRRYDEAIAQSRKTLELDQNYAWSHSLLGDAFEQKRMYQDAVAEWEKAMKLEGDDELEAILEHAYAEAGFSGAIRAVSQKRLDRLLADQNQRKYTPAIGFARAYVRLGQQGKSLDWLEKAYEERNRGMADIGVAPGFDGLRSESRFQDLLRRVGLPL